MLGSAGLVCRSGLVVAQSAAELVQGGPAAVTAAGESEDAANADGCGAVVTSARPLRDSRQVNGCSLSADGCAHKLHQIVAMLLSPRSPKPAA